MIRVAISEANEGNMLARSVANPRNPGEVLVKRGQFLNERVIRALERMGVRSLWIEGEALKSFEGFASEERASFFRNATILMRETFRKIAEDPTRQISFDSIRLLAKGLASEADRSCRRYALCDDLRQPQGDISVHSVNTGFLSALLAAELSSTLASEVASLRTHGSAQIAKSGKLADKVGLFGPIPEEISAEAKTKNAAHDDNGKPSRPPNEAIIAAALCGLMHDIGHIFLPPALRLRESWDMSREERDEIRKHTIKGATYLRPRLGDLVADVALLHHRLRDNSGYPRRDEVSSLSSTAAESANAAAVVSLASAYDEMTGRRDYLPIEAMEELRCARGHHFETVFLRALARVVPTFTPGSLVRISSGHYGAVLNFSPENPFRPGILLLRDPEGTQLSDQKQVELKLPSYAKLRIRSYGGKRLDHLQPDDPSAGWEAMS